MIFSRRVLCTLLCLSLFGGAFESVCAISWQRIAGTVGATAGVPGQPNAKHFILHTPALNNNGQVAFHSYLDSFSVSGGTDTIWGGTAQLPQLVARQGNIAPGTSEEFETFDFNPLLNDAGQILVSGSVSGPANQSDGLWMGTPGNLQLLARQNTAIAGSPYMIGSFGPSSLTFGDSGKAAFIGFTQSFETAMWYGSPGSLSVVAVGGSSVPASSGLPSGVKFQEFLAPLNAPVMNAAGKLAFSATIASGDLSIYGDSIWTGTPGNLQLLVREETSAPGVPGEEFSIIDTQPVINSSGEIAFGAHLTNHRDSIWLGTPGNLQMIVEGNDPAPVGSAGVRFSEIGLTKELRLSDSGHVGFEGWLEGTGVNPNNNYGLFRATTDGIDMVTRLGTQAPGLPNGALFNSFSNYSINPSGEMAFLGEVTTGGRGIWAQNGDGELELVVQVGDWVQLSTGDVVRSFEATNPTLLQSQGYDQVFMLDFRSAFKLSSEFGTAWNDDHKLAFHVTFANVQNGSAIYLADLAGFNGDFDEDGDVDGRDFLVWQRGGSPSPLSPGDLSAWRTNYGTGSLVALNAVPEPATALLAWLGVGGLGALAMRKRS